MPTSKELLGNITKMKKEISKMKQKVKKDTESLLKVSFKEIFKKHKNLESFSWVQYTPHWNDGDECTFSAHTDYLRINNSEDEVSFGDLESLYKDLLEKDKVIEKLTKDNVKLAKKKNESWQIKSNERRIKELQESDLNEIKWKYLALKDIEETLSVADDENLRDMFDDHVRVTVTRSGIETEYYQHD